MSRPKKSEMDPTPTKERLYQKALELFSVKGFDAVSVRTITRSLGLNEATLYIYYKNKSALLAEILSRLEQKLIVPGFVVPPPDYFRTKENFDLHSFLMKGAEIFFSRADTEILMIWRMLMISQYSYASARESIEKHLLNTPVHFFSSMIGNLSEAGLVSQDINSDALGRIIGSIFFDYSFRSNLKHAWGEEKDEDFKHLSQEIEQLVHLIMPEQLSSP